MIKFFKKAFFILLIINFFYTSLATADTTNFEIEGFDFDEASLNAELERLENLTDEDIKKSPVNTISPDEESVLAILASYIKDPLWQKTFSPRGRNPLYLMPYSISDTKYNGTQFNIFYNFTHKMPAEIGDSFSFNFRSKAEEEEFFKDVTEEIKARTGKDPSSSELAALLTLFKNIWVQERKSGILFKAGFYKNPFLFQIDLPIILSERNLMTTKEDQDQITSLLEKNFGSGEFDKEREFARIRIGIGDLKAKLGLNLIDFNSFKVNGGAAVIFPTATGFLLDGKFKTPDNETFSGGMFKSINDARNLLLFPELGNDNHFGIGTFLQGKLNFLKDKFSFWWQALYDDLLPAKEKRLIMPKKKLENPKIAAEIGTAELLEEFRDQYISPKEYNVMVEPGGVFNLTCMANYQLNRWNFGLGYDYYFKQREVFQSILDDNIDMNSLRINDATVNQAWQHKINAEFGYDIKLKHNSKLNISLGGDFTIFNHNLGKDLTIFGKLDFRF